MSPKPSVRRCGRTDSISGRAVPARIQTPFPGSLEGRAILNRRGADIDHRS